MERSIVLIGKCHSLEDTNQKNQKVLSQHTFMDLNLDPFKDNEEFTM